MTSSPGSTRASSVAAIASVAPQVTVSSASGFTSIPYHSRYFRATASRSRLAPQVMAYWLMSARMAAAAASLSTAGAGETGDPLASLMGAGPAGRRGPPRVGGVGLGAGGGGGGRSPLGHGGRGEIGEPLRQIDGAVLGGEPGHPADDRLGERVGAAGGAHRGAARFRLPNLTPVGPIGTDPAGGAGCRPGAAGSCDDGSPAARAYGTRTFPGPAPRA